METNRFRDDLPQYNRSRSIALPMATSDSMELCKYASVALCSIFRDGMHYKKAGCNVQALVPEHTAQAAFFDPVDPDKSRMVMTAMDTINGKQGRDRVRIAAQGYARTWRLRCENLSPAYTTWWNELMGMVV